MNSVYCPVCKKVTLWRRQIGVGHLIGFLATSWIPGAVFLLAGWHPWTTLLGPLVWVAVILAMRERCDRCGWASRPNEDQVPGEVRRLLAGPTPVLSKEERLRQIASD